MSRNGVTQMSPICAQGVEGCGDGGASEKASPARADQVPDFVSRALALGYDEAETWALWRQIAKTGRDVRARRITPAGGARRVDRLALAVAIVKVAGVAP